MDEAIGVIVHGIPVNVSPAKESRSTKGVFYFDAQLCNGKKSARLVSFDVSHMSSVKKAADEQSAIAVSNANVKRSSLSSELEVHLHKRSKVAVSLLKMSLGDVVLRSTKNVKVADVGLSAVRQDVELMCKVVKCADVSIVKKSGGAGELKKQDVVVGDETGTCRLVLWEGDVESLEDGKSYRLSDVGVRSYGGMKYLCYTGKSRKEVVEDLEDVNEGIGEEDDDWGHSISGEISAVLSNTEYLSCKLCYSKVGLDNGVVAECSKCAPVMKVSCCEQSKSAKFVVQDNSSGREMTLSAFEPILSRIVANVSGRNLSEKLLMAPGKVYKVNERNVVFSVQEQ